MGTRLTIRQLLQERLYADEDVLRGTCDGGSTNAIVEDTSELLSTAIGTTKYVGVWVFIDDTTDDAAPEGEERRVTAYSRSAGQLTVSPVFSAALGSGDTFELHYGFHPSRLNEAIARAVALAGRGLITAPTESLSQTAFEDELIVEGALYFLRLIQARRAKGPARADLFAEAEHHLQTFSEGVFQSGYGRLWLQGPAVSRDREEAAS